MNAGHCRSACRWAIARCAVDQGRIIGPISPGAGSRAQVWHKAGGTLDRRDHRPLGSGAVRGRRHLRR
jgi:hypothetical protein